MLANKDYVGKVRRLDKKRKLLVVVLVLNFDIKVISEDINNLKNEK